MALLGQLKKAFAMKLALTWKFGSLRLGITLVAEGTVEIVVTGHLGQHLVQRVPVWGLVPLPRVAKLIAEVALESDQGLLAAGYRAYISGTEDT